MMFSNRWVNSANPPTTWAEFLEAARVINEELGIYGAAFALDDPWVFETTVRSNGGAFLDEDGTPVLDSEAAVSSLTD
jgi:ABC-type glycerol-3-phosphate transport system substrate-binding protein